MVCRALVDALGQEELRDLGLDTNRPEEAPACLIRVSPARRQSAWPIANAKRINDLKKSMPRPITWVQRESTGRNRWAS
jgi:hypothetical protein